MSDDESRQDIGFTLDIKQNDDFTSITEKIQNKMDIKLILFKKYA